jgi:hypothetical protein
MVCLENLKYECNSLSSPIDEYRMMFVFANLEKVSTDAFRDSNTIFGLQHLVFPNAVEYDKDALCSMDIKKLTMLITKKNENRIFKNTDITDTELVFMDTGLVNNIADNCSFGNISITLLGDARLGKNVFTNCFGNMPISEYSSDSDSYDSIEDSLSYEYRIQIFFQNNVYDEHVDIDFITLSDGEKAVIKIVGGSFSERRREIWENKGYIIE